ncbi:MAG: ABC transporter ATP-binding protein [Brevirhabdus sp.]
MLEVQDISRPGLGPVSLTVPGGAAVAITGPSGAGKSLLLRAIVDLDPNEGEVRCEGGARTKMDAPGWRRLVAMVPAESGWWDEAVAAHFRDPDKTARRLPAVGLPETAMGWDVARLSTGERHRMAILRALEGEPEVLVLDEPTAALDGKSTTQVEALLLQEMARGMSLLLVTHDPDQPARLNARHLVLADGALTEAEA